MHDVLRSLLSGAVKSPVAKTHVAAAKAQNSNPSSTVVVEGAEDEVIVYGTQHVAYKNGGKEVHLL